MEAKKLDSKKLRRLIIIIFIAVFAIISFVYLRNEYIQYQELGENYLDVFFTNLKYKYTIFGINFIILYIMIYFTNNSIKKGLKVFFDEEKKEMPKIPNKSISFITSVIVSTIASNVLMEKILLVLSNSTFGIADPIFNLDISFYIFIKPLISSLLIYFIGIIAVLSIYMALYYIIIFNKYFDGVDGELIKNSLLIKKVLRNVMIAVVLIAILTVINTTNINLNKLLTINTSEASDNIEIIGASYSDDVIQRWAYLIFAFVIVIAAIRAIKAFKNDNTAKVIKNLVVIPGYLIGMFLVIIVFNLIFVNSNTLEKQKQYLENNIQYTKSAFNIEIDENDITNEDAITYSDVSENTDIIDNIKIVNSNVVLSTLNDSQTGTGYYSYRSANIAKYNISGEVKLVYVSPREYARKSKTEEYTSGVGQIVVDSTSVTETGTINYIQKDINASDDVLGTENQEINYGLESVINRAKTAMPYLVYDQNPYTVVTSEGKIVWVLDAYTISSQYPYSQYISLEHDNVKDKINYIRNSVKVIVDSYDGTMKFYITDKTDPIAMAYRNIYPTLFEDLNTEIPEDISEHFVYPEYLYNVQAELLKIYHNVKYDVLYRTDDLWDFAKFNSTIISQSTGTVLEPYYAMIKDGNNEEIGLIQIYTPESKQNLISYLVGTTDGSTNKLKLYKYYEDSSILGPMQLDNQIEQDETISAEIEALNTTGSRVTKDMIVVPINDTLLYVESIYQTMLNEEPRIPTLKKIVVASGNKLAIGDSLEDALNKLLSKEASNIEIDNTEDIDGMIDAIIKANKNLTESADNNDWELMGSDIERLQSLIDTLEELKAEQDKKKEEENNIVNEIENNVVNDVNEVVGNNLVQ